MIHAVELADIGRAVKARHVATPMSEAYTVDPDEPAPEAAAALVERQFDFAPVVATGAFAASSRRATGRPAGPSGNTCARSTQTSSSPLTRRSQRWSPCSATASSSWCSMSTRSRDW